MNRTNRNPNRIVKIAIACFGDEIAPCFSVARHFRTWEFKHNETINYRELVVVKLGHLARLRMLKQIGINVLICNGIEEQSRYLLENSDCQVIDGVSCSVADALTGYVTGKIHAKDSNNLFSNGQRNLNRNDLVDWTRKLISSLGWTVEVASRQRFPVDLIVSKKITFPLIRVAVCFGGHIFCAKKEICEFNCVTSIGYHGRIYIYQSIPHLMEQCNSYGIELIDPTNPGQQDNHLQSYLESIEQRIAHENTH